MDSEVDVQLAMCIVHRTTECAAALGPGKGDCSTSHVYISSMMPLTWSLPGMYRAQLARCCGLLYGQWSWSTVASLMSAVSLSDGLEIWHLCGRSSGRTRAL